MSVTESTFSERLVYGVIANLHHYESDMPAEKIKADSRWEEWVRQCKAKEQPQGAFQPEGALWTSMFYRINSNPSAMSSSSSSPSRNSRRINRSSSRSPVSTSFRFSLSRMPERIPFFPPPGGGGA